MSLFGALMGDIEDEPFIGNHMRRINSIMNTFMRDPFADLIGGPMGGMGMLAPPPMMDMARHGDQRQMALARQGGHQNPFGASGLMPMGFPNMSSFFLMSQNPGNCHSFSSSSVMTMTQGPDGRPQVYQASTSTRQAPGGIKETKKTVADSRTGLKKMAIGHHIGERAHVIEREQNVYSGEKEERQELINLDEDEAEDFDKEWERKTKASGSRQHALTYGNPHHRHHREPQLALPSSSSSYAHQGETLKPGQKRKSQPPVEVDVDHQPKNKKVLIDPPQIVLDDDDDDDVEENDDVTSSGEESD